MTNALAKTLLQIGATPDGKFFSLEYEGMDAAKSALLFPSDQLDWLLELLLNVRRRAVEEPEGSTNAKSVLRVDSVEVAFQPQEQTVLLDFRVGERKLAFALPRVQAVQLMEIIKKALPAH